MSDAVRGGEFVRLAVKAESHAALRMLATWWVLDADDDERDTLAALASCWKDSTAALILAAAAV